MRAPVNRREFMRRPHGSITMDQALEYLSYRQQEEADRQEPSGDFLKFDADFETFPTPADPTKREHVARFEKNIDSVATLITQLNNFIERAEVVSAQIPRDRDPQELEIVDAYFSRLRGLLARIFNDLSGNNYTSENTHRPIQSTELSEEALEQISSVSADILQTMGMANTGVLIDPAGQRMGYGDQALFPFDRSLRGAIAGARYLQQYTGQPKTE